MCGKSLGNSVSSSAPRPFKKESSVINSAPAQKLDRLEDYFNKLGDILNELNLKDKPLCLYNMDEKGCILTINYQQSVTAQW